MRIGVSEAAVREEALKRPLPEGDVIDDTPLSPAVDTTIAQTPLERAIAMVALRYGSTRGERERLIELVGEDRVKEIERMFVSDKERILFEFDMLGEDETHIAQELLQTIERALIQEKIGALQSSLRQGGSEEQNTLLRELSTLKKREQELRGS